MKNFYFKKAFSFAETLIVIVILGVIGALILRTLTFEQSKTSVIALKKIYYALTNTMEDVVNNSFFYTYNPDIPRILETPNTDRKDDVAKILELPKDEAAKLNEKNWLCFTIKNRMQIKETNCASCSEPSDLSFVTPDNTAVFGLCGNPSKIKYVYIYTDKKKYKGDIYNAVSEGVIPDLVENDKDNNAYRFQIKTTGIILPDDDRAKKILLDAKIKR